MTKSVQKGVFPSKRKKAEVVHVYKNDDKPEPGNCRSISLLSIFNRIFEKLKYHRLKSFRSKNGILFKSHYGFREKNIPLNMPLLTVLMSFKYNMDQKFFTIVTISETLIKQELRS